MGLRADCAEQMCRSGIAFTCPFGRVSRRQTVLSLLHYLTTLYELQWLYYLECYAGMLLKGDL
jgi:hypothetical protein